MWTCNYQAITCRLTSVHRQILELQAAHPGGYFHRKAKAPTLQLDFYPMDAQVAEQVVAFQRPAVCLEPHGLLWRCAPGWFGEPHPRGVVGVGWGFSVLFFVPAVGHLGRIAVVGGLDLLARVYQIYRLRERGNVLVGDVAEIANYG